MKDERIQEIFEQLKNLDVLEETNGCAIDRTIFIPKTVLTMDELSYIRKYVSDCFWYLFLKDNRTSDFDDYKFFVKSFLDYFEVTMFGTFTWDYLQKLKQEAEENFKLDWGSL